MEIYTTVSIVFDFEATLNIKWIGKETNVVGIPYINPRILHLVWCFIKKTFSRN